MPGSAGGHHDAVEASREQHVRHHPLLPGAPVEWVGGVVRQVKGDYCCCCPLVVVRAAVREYATVGAIGGGPGAGAGHDGSFDPVLIAKGHTVREHCSFRYKAEVLR